MVSWGSRIPPGQGVRLGGVELETSRSGHQVLFGQCSDSPATVVRAARLQPCRLASPSRDGLRRALSGSTFRTRPAWVQSGVGSTTARKTPVRVTESHLECCAVASPSLYESEWNLTGPGSRRLRDEQGLCHSLGVSKPSTPGRSAPSDRDDQRRS